MMKRMQSLILLSMLFAVTACGDLLGTKVIKKDIDTTRFRADCDLEIDAFRHILHQNISSQIRCLGANLNLFIKVVKSERPGYMNRTAFEAYLRKNQTGITPEVLKALKQIYELNYLLRGEDREYISQDNVNDVIELAIVFNEQMALNFEPIFQSDREATYTLHRIHKGRIRDAANKVMVALLKVFNEERGGRIDTLDIPKLLEAFTTKDTADVIKKIEKVLFVKKVILGGEKTILSHQELQRFMFSFPYLAEIALDAVRYEYVLLDQKSIIALLKQDIEHLTGIILNPKLGNRDNELFFTMEDLYETVRLFVPKEDLDIDKFKKLAAYGKKIIMGGGSKQVYGVDFKNLLYHGDKILLQGQLFHQMYDKYRVMLESKLPVSINYNQAITSFPEYPNELKKFIRIVQNYRFMKGEFDSAFYTREWRRNPDAVFEIGLYEYLLDLIMRFKDPEPDNVEVAGYKCKQEWGTQFSYSGTTFTHAIDQYQTQCILKRIEKELISLDLIIPHRAISTADTISLLATLFQYQSDENVNPQTKKGLPILDVNEATEFATSLITGIGLTDELMVRLEDTCKNELDEFKRISPTCFRKHFLKYVCEDYRDYYPHLFDSLGANDKCEIPATDYNLAYLDMTIKASRTCTNYEDDNHKPTEEIPYNAGDVMSILVEMYHVEATFLRWDKNKNNLLDAKEVDDAYQIYSWALDGFLVDKPSYIKLFKKQIYQYMIKFEEVPNEKDPKSIARFVKFLLSPSKKAPATRKTFSSVLYGISEENKKIRIANGTETFQCNWLKDPNNIPAEEDRKPIPASEPKESYSSVLQMVEMKGVDQSGEPVFDIPAGKCLVDEEGKEFCSEEQVILENMGTTPRKKHCLSVLGKTLFCL